MADSTRSVWDYARDYARKGIYVFPLRVRRDANGKKDVRPLVLWREASTTSLADIGAWEQTYGESCGLGIDTGKSGLVVVDCDGEDGIANWDALNTDDQPEPLGMGITSSGGEHWFYRADPDHVIGNDQSGKVAPHVDVRGLGGFVIAPPTTDGAAYWHWALPLGGGPSGAYVPQVVIDRMRAPVPRESSPIASAPADDLFDTPGEPERRYTGNQARAFVKKAADRLKAAESGLNGEINNFAMACAHFPWMIDRQRCAGLVQRYLGQRMGWPAPDRDDLKTIDSAYRATEAGRSWIAVEVEAGAAPAEVAQDDEPEDRWTDAMLSGRLVRERLTERAVFTMALGWLQWSGQVWRAVPDEVMHEVCRKWLLKQYEAACADYFRRAPEHKLHEDGAVRGAAGAQSAGRISAIVKLARGQLIRDASEFDTRDELLNTPGGVVDLRTGEVGAHDPALLITKMTAVTYDPDATSPLLAQALEAVPADAREWLAMRMGEAATGVSSEQLVLVTGTGRNGKTALIGACFRALGSYAAKVPNTLLLRTRATGGATPERMTLRGVRLAYMEETPEDGYLDANVVKELLDAEEIEGRHLYRDIVSWRPTHSIFLNTNHAPTMGDTGDGAWRRLTRVDFPYRFRKAGEAMERPSDRPGDPGIKQGLTRTEAGQEAVLAWIVAGARAFYARGEREARDPASVVASMRRWREESDDLYRFVNECMVIEPDGLVARTDLYDAFVYWLGRNGQRSMSAKTFAQRLAGHSALGKLISVVRVAGSDSRLTRPVDLLKTGMFSDLGARPWAYQGLAFGDAARSHVL